MNAAWPLSRSPVGTRRAWRKRRELQRWLNGEQGPEWWEIVPALAAVLAVIGVPLAGLGWLWSRVGWWTALLAAAALACGVRAAARQRRAVARAAQAAGEVLLPGIDGHGPGCINIST
ncbi:hypothetical protein [Streptomyces sp. NPDC060322]|uniref:hypothetical protein n=1 Tax=Streptomyces sp. NPDC060322 TaxID=3347097 RepID=UPI00366122B4